ncbi:MAG TPA: phosphatidate cytidylyltransferase [Casimicrobiaceae bacterium]|nr:phosphatidate cytidylyltransferase [Casimicrobiaceae bacterium]
MAASSLATRVATAVVLVPLVLAALFLLSTRGWAIVLLVIVVVAAWEWARLCKAGSAATAGFVLAAAVGGTALLWSATGGDASNGFPDAVVYAVCGSAAAFWLLVAPRWLAAGWPFAGRIAPLIVGAIVLAGTWVALVELQSHSPWLVLAAMAVVWIADTAAYFTGRRFGRRKLAPDISPNKTWEGVWGGLAGVAAYALLLALLAPSPVLPMRLSVVAVVGFVAGTMLLGGVSVVGDLFESLMKRQAGVKDSGSLLPGHGGVLDRVDALLAAMPLAAIAATLWLVPRA